MTNSFPGRIIFTALWLSGVLLLGSGAPVFASAEVGLSGDTSRNFLTADSNGRYQFVNVPLRRNAVNKFTVTARDGDQVQSKEVKITQISLESVVVSKIKSTPLTVQEIEKLVNDGVIDIDDPANFNVSVFQIVLTIGGREVGIDFPMVRAVQAPEGEEAPPPPPNDPGRPNSNPNPPEIVVFEVQPPPIPGGPPPPPIPGVLIIEGRIKTLKEFYSVRLLLLNTSGIFTLHDVIANIEFPDGGLSTTLPSDGIVQFGDIFPGDGEVPGQKEREFIIRGDEIGVRKVKVNFGGTIIGGGIPEDEVIPFNGSADTTVEVKGPPEFRVQVIHPPAVVQDVPYELIVDIQNIGDTPALYTSFELDVGADGSLVDCVIDDTSLLPVCTPIEGSAVRNIGHLMPGARTRQSFMINPHVSGPVTSCIAVADQNIDLQVHVGDLGCIVGERTVAQSPDGVPTLSVLPAANAFGIGIDSPVVAIFNEQMNESTITIGAAGTFRVFDPQGNLVPGQLRVVPLGDHTAAIYQVEDGITNRWKGNTTYTVEISDQIYDLQGLHLENSWTSQFTTTDPTNDTTPPALTLSIEPPVIPSQVLPGQIIRLNAYASDQGSHVSRVELRMRDEDTAGSVFELIDQKTVFPEQSGPIIFSVDSANLQTGHIYQFKATAFDNAGNSQDATIAAIIAQTAAAPTIGLPEDPADPVLHGISISLAPETLTGGVLQVDYYLDSALDPFATVTLPPYSMTLNTLGMALGNHTIRAVARDGLNQTGEDHFTFELAENPNEPVVDFGGAADGQQYLIGAPVIVNANATDPTGIQSVAFFLDAPAGTPVATSTEPFQIPTEGLSPGTHKLYFAATNKAGNSNDLSDPASILEFVVLAEPPPGPPPPPPQVTTTSFPVNGLVTLTGASVPLALVDLENLTQPGITETVFADGTGAFQAKLSADAGNQIRLVAFDLSQSPTGSTPVTVVVPAAPELDHITVSPDTKIFSAPNQFQDITVTGFYAGGISQVVTGQAVFSSSDASVASVNSAGRIAGLANGNAVITASFNGKQAQVSVTVQIVTLNSISMDPASFKLFGAGKTRQLQVIGSYSNGSSSPLNSGVVFASNNPSIVNVGASGLVTALAHGDAVITASVAGVLPAQAQVTVEPVAPSSIEVSPNAILFTAAGETRQLDVTVHYNDGTIGAPQDTVDFTSDQSGIASVDTNGLVTAAANGDALITVHHLGFDAQVTVVVNIPAVVTPTPVLSALDRPRAAEGDVVVLRGQFFAPVPLNNHVTMNGTAAAVQSARQDELEVIVPKGATSGPVLVEVGGKTSNSLDLGIYARIAQTSVITLAIDMPASSGTTLNLPGPQVDFQSGDRVFLSGAPDILAPLGFNGVLRARIDEAPFFAISPSSDAVEITSHFTPGIHNITLDLGEAAGKFKTSAIYLIAGPNASGGIAGFRSVMANGQSRPTAVTFINLKDAIGNPLSDGSKVVVTAGNHCFRDPVTNGCIPSSGGAVTNGTASPDGFGLRVFTVTGGRIDVVYDPETAPPLRARQSSLANLQVLPANAAGSRTADRALVLGPVTLTSFDTVGSPTSQTSVVADGLQKILTVHFVNARDTAGQPVPDGTPFLVTAGNHCFRDPVTNACIESAAGSVLSGTASPDGFGLFKHVISGGEVTVQYSPGSTLLAYPDVAVARLQFLPATPAGNRIDNSAFQITPITLSSAQSPTVIAASSVFADFGDNRVIVTFKDFKDALGNPVPDGTKVVVTAGNHCFRDPVTNGCIASAGGNIISGDPSPDGFGLQIHSITAGQIQVTYSASPVGLQTRQSALVTVQVLPSTPAGNRIGNRALAVAPFTAVGFQSAVVSASPSAVVADGLSKTVTVTLTNIRDTAGNVVPDGVVVLLTAGNHCFRNPDDSTCIPSAGGVIKSGTASPDGFGLMAHVVLNGQVTAEYDPGSVTAEYPSVLLTHVQVLPGIPGTLSRIGNTAFAIIPVSLSSLSQAGVQILPASVFADGADRRSTVSLTAIKDGNGNTVPNGTKFVATASNSCFRDPVTNGCIPSAGGTIKSGVSSPDGFGLQTHAIQDGAVDIFYSTEPLSMEARQAVTANIQILPSQPSGNRVGNRAFIVAPVTVAGYQSADISGPGQLTPGGQGTYVVSNIRDTSGNLVPDGATVLITATAACFRDPDTGNCIGSSGGSVINGTASPDGFGLRAFVIAGGEFSVTFQAPAGTGTSVLQLLPGRASGNRTGNTAFALKSVSVQP